MNPKTLFNIIHRNPAPEPWSEGDNIPWNEPAFSKRMLKEHLTQEHDAASRRFEKIDQHIDWIHQTVLGGQSGKLLDLGCGPGLYASRLTQMGHQVTGIDYSPASINYAKEQAVQANQKINYIHADIREADYSPGGGDEYDTAMQIFGETNVFRTTDLRKILAKAYHALRIGGKLILEAHTFEAIKTIGNEGTSWHSAESGLFAEKPHLVLSEHIWDASLKTATIRHFVFETENENVIRYAQSLQAYSDAEYRALLTKTGFGAVQFYPSLTGNPDPEQKFLFVITAEKK